LQSNEAETLALPAVTEVFQYDHRISDLRK